MNFSIVALLTGESSIFSSPKIDIDLFGLPFGGFWSFLETGGQGFSVYIALISILRGAG
jgi:hypothetical protein